MARHVRGRVALVFPASSCGDGRLRHVVADLAVQMIPVVFGITDAAARRKWLHALRRVAPAVKLSQQRVSVMRVGVF
jgi:hypothetical protein